MITWRWAQQWIETITACTNPNQKVPRVCSDTWNHGILGHTEGRRWIIDLPINNYFSLKLHLFSLSFDSENLSRDRDMCNRETSRPPSRISERRSERYDSSPHMNKLRTVVSNPAGTEPRIPLHPEPEMVVYTGSEVVHNITFRMRVFILP